MIEQVDLSYLHMRLKSDEKFRARTMTSFLREKIGLTTENAAAAGMIGAWAKSIDEEPSRLNLIFPYYQLNSLEINAQTREITIMSALLKASIISFSKIESISFHNDPDIVEIHLNQGGSIELSKDGSVTFDHR